MIKVYSRGSSDFVEKMKTRLTSVFTLMLKYSEMSHTPLSKQIDGMLTAGTKYGFTRVGPFLFSDNLVFDFSDAENGGQIEFIKI